MMGQMGQMENPFKLKRNKPQGTFDDYSTVPLHLRIP
jgi:hypothetical protein